ncbi:MAG: hypothetical protein ACRC30_10880 [Clostridium sp.]
MKFNLDKVNTEVKQKTFFTQTYGWHMHCGRRKKDNFQSGS